MPAEAGTTVGFVPKPPTSFVGRRRLLASLARALDVVPVALLYGVPGAGKSALAYAFARRWPGPVCHAQAFATHAPETLIDDVRRSLDGGPTREFDGLVPRVAALADALEAAGALLVIDDLHRWPEETRALVVRTFGERLGRGRLVATSRERLTEAGHYDRYEAVVGGLTKGVARQLWGVLDALRGSRPGFDQAFRRCGGNPFALRRAHAGFEFGENPLDPWLARLDDDTRLALGALSVARVPLDAAALGRLLPGGRGERALAALVRLLLVDVDGAGACSVHTLVGEAAAGLGETTLREAHVGLAQLLTELGLDPVVGVREAAHHLLEAGEHAAARSLLLGAARDFVRRGASGDLLLALDRLPFDLRSDAVDTWRARALTRLLRLGDAAEVLAERLPRAREGRAALWTLAASVALMRFRFDECETALREAEAGDTLEGRSEGESSPRPLVWRALLEAARGDVSAGVGRLTEGAARAATPQTRLWLRGTASFLVLLDRYAEALGRPEGVEGYRAAALLPIFVGDFGAKGRTAIDSTALLGYAESSLAAHHDLASLFHLDGVRALRRWEQGERYEASATLRAIAETAERTEYLNAALWLHVWVARTLFVLGRCREARALSASVGRRALALGAGWVARAAEHACREDPAPKLARLLTGEAPRLDASASVRTRCFAALRAQALGDEAAATAALAGVADAITRPGHGVERALVRLAAGLNTRHSGDEDSWAQANRDAEAHLRDEGADEELLAALLAALHEAAPSSRQRSLASPGAPTVVLDGRRHELRWPGHALSLRSRPALRALLYALAAAPGNVVPKESLARALWQAKYDPRRHDNPLFVNICRLRESLANTPLAVVNVGQAGYVLETPTSFSFVPEAADQPRLASG